jgi:hypothetical protein
MMHPPELLAGYSPGFARVSVAANLQHWSGD